MSASLQILMINADEPECVSVNSLLRNSGINVRIKRVNSTMELTRSISDHPPLLSLFRVGKQNAVSYEDAARLAREHQTLLVIQSAPEHLDFVRHAMSNGSIVLLNINLEQQLIDLVQQQLKLETREHEFSRQQQRIRELERLKHQLLDGSEEAIAYVHEGLHIDANRTYQKLMGFTDISKLQAISLLELVHGTEVDIKSVLRETANGHFPENPITVNVLKKSGAEFSAQLLFEPAQVNGEDCIQIRVRRNDQDQRFSQDSDHSKDAGPGGRLVNRKHFLCELQSFVNECKKDNTRGALLCLEPDQAGDLAKSMGYTGFIDWIERLSGLVRGCISEKDQVTQLGEYSFAILLKDDPGQRAASTFDSIVKAVDETKPAGVSAGCDISAGVATIAAHTREADEAIEQVQLALQDAKSHGSTLKRFEPARIKASMSDDGQQWGDRIRHALNSQSFYSVQSAIVNLEGESEGLFENRVCLKEGSEDIPAAEFMPYAEQHELGSAIDRLVIPGLLKAISGAGDRHILALSANSLLDFSFPSWFQHQIQELGVQGSQLIVQTPAPVAVSNLRQCRKLSQELRNYGVRFSLSGFDEQDRHCQLLREIDVDLVSLHSGLCEALKSNAANRAAVRKVVLAAEQAGAVVVAGDVQDAADMATLWQCGVRLVCGDYLRELSQISG